MQHPLILFSSGRVMGNLSISRQQSELYGACLGGAGAAGGSRRPRRLTESRLAQWPQRTVTVLNRLLQGTPTCARMHIEIEERRISQHCVRCWLLR